MSLSTVFRPSTRTHGQARNAHLRARDVSPPPPRKCGAPLRRALTAPRPHAARPLGALPHLRNLPTLHSSSWPSLCVARQSRRAATCHSTARCRRQWARRAPTRSTAHQQRCLGCRNNSRGVATRGAASARHVHRAPGSSVAAPLRAARRAGRSCLFAPPLHVRRAAATWLHLRLALHCGSCTPSFLR